jgi:hypothetical protein
MKIIHIETLIFKGNFSKSKFWQSTNLKLQKSIRSMNWPINGKKFIIYPESGKKRGKGNGVKPIKLKLMEQLKKADWELEKKIDLATVKMPGKLDAVLNTPYGPVALEWETGNISSSHRAINKMALGLLKKKLIGGILVVPTKEFSQYLTDRIGNYPELEPYLELWKSIPIKSGVLQIIVVEHDGISTKVPKIPKGTDGRSAN